MRAPAVADLQLRYHYTDKDPRNGRPRHYCRRPDGRKVRLREEPGSEAFMEEFLCALRGVPYAASDNPQPVKVGRKAAPGSFAWLCQRYFVEAAGNVTVRTMSVRRTILEEICEGHGDKPFKKLEQRHVLTMREKRLPRGKDAADALVKAVSALFAWAITARIADRNPCQGIGRLGGKGEGFLAWKAEDVARFEEIHHPGTMPWIALRVLLFSGARRADAAALGPKNVSMVRDPETGEKKAWLRFRPSKTVRSSGTVVEQEMHPELVNALTYVPEGARTFIRREDGAPFSVNGLGNAMRKWCDRAGLPDLSAHGLRKLGASLVAENGGSHEHLKAWFGWTTHQQADHYVKSARRREISRSAVKFLVLESRNGPQNPTSDARDNEEEKVK